MKANWNIHESVLSSRDDLYNVIDGIRNSKQPTMVFLEADNGRMLVFGVGSTESVLTFAEPDGSSYHSLGNPERKGHLLFLCRDQVDEFMAEMAVPEDDALRAAEEFFSTQERPEGIVWEADW